MRDSYLLAEKFLLGHDDSINDPINDPIKLKTAFRQPIKIT